MNYKCEQCGQPALDSDVLCWHCGEPIPGREERVPVTAQVKESWQETYSLSSIGLVALSLLLVIIGTLLTMGALGRRPLVQIGFGTRPPSAWQTITGDGLTFTMNLPGSWQRIDGQDQLTRVTSNNYYRGRDLFFTGLLPLSMLANDLEFLYIAVNEQTVNDSVPVFVVVGRSASLSALAYEDVGEFLTDVGDLEVSASFVDDFDRTHLRINMLTPTNPSEEDQLQCNQQFIGGGSTAMIVSVCSPLKDYDVNKTKFADILGSFQRLR